MLEGERGLLGPVALDAGLDVAVDELLGTRQGQDVVTNGLVPTRQVPQLVRL